MSRRPVLERRPEGLYCPAGRFYIDPWKPVDKAVITHGHSDHARWGSKAYLCTTESVPILRARLGEENSISGHPYAHPLRLGDATVSFHPAGHVTGSAQIRVEVDGEVWVVTGDYKTAPDRTSTPFEPVECHGLVTETTFGLPIYRWQPEEETMAEVRHWWAANMAARRSSIVFAYSLGKAQRLIAGVGDELGPIYVHGAVATMNRAVESAGVSLPEWKLVSEAPAGMDWTQALIVAPPSADGSPWLRRFKNPSRAFASGWMAVRGARRRRSVDKGFVLSDHVDWVSLLQTVEASKAETVWTTHGYAHQVARYLREERGLDATPIQTEFVGETVDTVAEAAEGEEPVDA